MRYLCSLLPFKKEMFWYLWNADVHELLTHEHATEQFATLDTMWK